MARTAFLLRGVNVGRAHRLPMADLRRIAADLGHEDVATHLQSGNLLSVPPGDARSAADVLAGRLEEELGFAVPVVVRTHAELAAVAADDPFDGRATDPSRHSVLFAAEPFAPGVLDDVDPADHAPDEVALRDREVHLWTPDGLHASRLARAVTTRVGEATARNRRTVARLLEMTG